MNFNVRSINCKFHIIHQLSQVIFWLIFHRKLLTMVFRIPNPQPLFLYISSFFYQFNCAFQVNHWLSRENAVEGESFLQCTLTIHYGLALWIFFFFMSPFILNPFIHQILITTNRSSHSSSLFFTTIHYSFLSFYSSQLFSVYIPTNLIPTILNSKMEKL